MNIGKLRHKVTIQLAADLPDGGGGYEEKWNDYATAWANIRPLRGNETTRAEQSQHSITHIVTMRFRPDVKPSGMRLMYKKRALDIQTVINQDEANKFIELQCIEGESA